MSNPDVTYDKARKMTYDELLAAAGLKRGDVKPTTYLYIDTDGGIAWTSVERGGTPADEYVSLGYATRLRGSV